MEFDEKFLQEMGLLTMPEEQKQAFLDYVKEELEVRIGERIAKGVPEAKLVEFDHLTDPQAIGRWLEKTRPDYREIVEKTIAEMKAEIRANREKLL